MFDASVWDRCVSFHGHACPGLAIGVRAAQAALDFFMDDIQDESAPGISCVTTTDKCPSDGIRCMLCVEEGRGLTIKPSEGEIVFDFSMDGKHIILTTRPKKTRLDRDASIVYTLNGPLEELFDIRTRY